MFVIGQENNKFDKKL